MRKVVRQVEKYVSPESCKRNKKTINRDQKRKKNGLDILQDMNDCEKQFSRKEWNEKNTDGRYQKRNKLRQELKICSGGVML